MTGSALGAVVDFIDVHWYSSFHWPAFNVADSAITIGICLLALDMLIDMRKKKHPHAAGENRAVHPIIFETSYFSIKAYGLFVAMGFLAGLGFALQGGAAAGA